jgi:AraC family transcriptional regulator
MVTKILSVKNVSSGCCVKLIRRILSDIGVVMEHAGYGEVTVTYDDEAVDLAHIVKQLQREGFEIISDKEQQLVEQIKSAVFDLIHHTTSNAMIRNSDFLVQKFNLSYQHISSVFSANQNITLEKYIIQQKIEKAKELIAGSDLTLSEIAYMMGYSSVQYLSTQFRHVTGVSVSEFKKDIEKYAHLSDDFTAGGSGSAVE